MRKKKAISRLREIPKAWVYIVVFGVVLPFLCLLALRYCDFLFYPDRRHDLGVFKKYVKYNLVIDAAAVIYMIWLLVLVAMVVLWVLWDKKRRASGKGIKDKGKVNNV